MTGQKNKLKVMCVTHGKDVDGCVSASIIKLATNSNFLLTNYGGIDKSLKRIKDIYDIVYICDLGINDTIIDELKRIRSFSELVYIDHHHVDQSLLTQLRDIGVEIIHDLRDCASVLTFDLFKDKIPREAGLLACYGAYSDRLENGHLAKEIIQNFDRDFVLFETMLLTYALDRADLNFKKKIVKGLSNLEYPHNIDNVTTHALNQVNRIAELRKGWGLILEVWEGYAADPEIRFKGSSGGLATALALFCLEKEDMYGTLHIGADDKKPWNNMTVLSHDREDLLTRTGSRYSPASACDGLDKIEQAPRPCVFIGKPCEVVGLRKAQSLKTELDQKVGLAMGIFCAGTPSTQGTLELLQQFKVDPQKVEEIRYRGKGWPGAATVRLKREDVPFHQMSYMKSWGFLQRYRAYRCYLCPDGTSQFADISCGDPWHRHIEREDPGHSLILVRTERGREIIRGAMESGYVLLERATIHTLGKSQNNLLEKRDTIWGRLIAMSALGIPRPRLKGFYLFENWCDLPLSEKIRSVLGTLRRIIQRRYYRPQKCNHA